MKPEEVAEKQMSLLSMDILERCALIPMNLPGGESVTHSYIVFRSIERTKNKDAEEILDEKKT